MTRTSGGVSGSDLAIDRQEDTVPAIAPVAHRRGAIAAVWASLREEVWVPLAMSSWATDDLFADLYREIPPYLKETPTAGEVMEVVSDGDLSRSTFLKIDADHFDSEAKIVAYLEDAYGACEENGGDELAAEYYRLLHDFAGRHGLRYEIRPPFSISISTTGLFMGLLDDLQHVASFDSHTRVMLMSLEEAIHELRFGATPARIATCIQKQFNLLEAYCRNHPDVTSSVLSDQIRQMSTWPHAALKASLTNIYGFASDYPGIRHAGNPSSQLRELDARDLVGMIVVLMGFMPLLSSNAEAHTHDA